MVNTSIHRSILLSLFSLFKTSLEHIINLRGVPDSCCILPRSSHEAQHCRGDGSSEPFICIEDNWNTIGNSQPTAIDQSSLQGRCPIRQSGRCLHRNRHMWMVPRYASSSYWVGIHQTDIHGTGTAVTCASPAACGFSSTFRACCVGHACSSSTFNTVCLPYDDSVCLAGTPGPATRCWSVCPNILRCHWITDTWNARSTDTSSPACLTLFWPTTPGAPDLTIFTMVDSCVPISRAGQGIMVTSSPPQTPAQSSSQPSSSSPLLKPPAGTILEAILGVTAVSVLVIISCIIITRKVHASRTGALRPDASRSSLTVSASAGQEGREPDIPLSIRPGSVRADREIKRDRSHCGNRKCRLEAAREQEM